MWFTALQVSFPASTLNIPDVNYETARVVGVPLLPFFRIAIDAQSLQVPFTSRQSRLRILAPLASTPGVEEPCLVF